ncbi:MAG TPA: chemotaxis protein CheW [Longimicrobiales bacterium]|nr:chemotaxis protein CheW [Longimicrobiales bacterium]
MSVSSPASSAQVASRQTPRWVVFRCADHRFAFPVGQIREILEARPLARLPGCGPEVGGLANLRGRIVTVFDFGASLSLRPSIEKPGHQLLVAEGGDRPAAFVVEEVLAVVSAVTHGLSVSVEDLKVLDAYQEGLLGVGDWGGKAFLALDAGSVLERLWASDDPTRISNVIDPPRT